MFKIVKKILKYLFITFFILLLGLISVPFLFKEKIKAKVLEEIDKNINAEVNFSNVSFSTFKNFPHLTVSLKDLAIVGIGDFKGDTLASAKEISISLNIRSVLKGNDLEINKVELEGPLIYARILPNGKANYNIIRSDTTNTRSAKSNFEISIDSWGINNGRLIYDDRLQKTYIEIGGLFHKGSGDFKAEISDLDITTKVSDLTFMYGGIKYFDKKFFNADLNMEMNFKEKKFTFKDHTFQLGHFKFGFDGYFKLLDNGYETDLTFIVKETSFKNLLSLLPGIYQKDMDGIETKGEFSCTGFVKGVYDVKDGKVPAYHVDLKVKDAMFKYSHLPKAVERINFDLVADNPDGNTEHASLDLKTFHFEIDKEPVHGSVYLKGIKNMHVRADIKLKADLAQIEKIYPIDSLVLKGIVTSEIKINGRYNDSLKLFPKVDAFFTLEKGYVKSIGVPLEMDSMHINAEVINSTGALADTKINLNNMTFLLDGEPFVMNGTIADMKDYNYNLKIDGLIDLGKLTQIYPIQNTSLKGTMNFDITTDGSLTEIEAKKYALLKTAGTLEIKEMAYKSTDLAFPVHIDDALFTFDADKIILSRFKAEFGKSNVALSGHLYNYIPYLLKSDAPIKGDLAMNCDTIDMNQWFPASVSDKSPSTPKADTTKATAKEALIIPGNIDFTIDSDIKMVKFGAMNISDLNGEIKIKNGVCTLNETGFNALDSKFVLSGDYDTRDEKHPLFDLHATIDKLNFNKAYKMFVDPKGTAPAEGNFSTKYDVKGELAPGFMPIYSTLTGGGKIVIDSVAVKGMKIMNHIKNVSKKEEFNDPSLSDVTIDTEIKGGKVFMKPFTFKVSKFLTEVEGWQGFDEKMEYLIKMSVPPFTKLKIPVSISGTSDKPVIKMGKGFNNADLENLQ
ncbi:MAG TPA: AsmA-like C-terminal region-containing protein [Bacteroidia bacterium]|nr:AsmA-like C-terminal region-containing protein [Bacteroidia bacterium]